MELIVFGSDGASWGSTGVELYPGALHLIDAFHFHRWVTGVFGFRQRALVDTMKTLIEADDREGFSALMQAQQGKYPGKKKEINRLQKTIEKN